MAKRPIVNEDKPKHKRRPRYKGRNPRSFEHRYKELDPEKYPEAVKRIEAKGNTPAGTHRPICVEEILSLLDPKPGESALDVTLGYGGHAKAILPRLLPGGLLVGVDADPIELPKTEARFRAAGFEEDVFLVQQMNYSGVRGVLYAAGGGFDCILADLGVSSMQLDNPARGFTHKAEGPLDLRLNPRKGKPASELLGALSAEELETLLRENADEPQAKVIAQAVVERPDPIVTTTELADFIVRKLRGRRVDEKSIKKSVQRTFMALRIEVNQELESLERFLNVLPACLNPGGRVAILSFHSGEDRRVKKAFARGVETGDYTKVAPTPIRPSPQECRSNPRSTCAKLRWAVRS